MAGVAKKQALRAFKGLLETGAYSDLTITCGSDTYKVHKAVVCERLDFFARALGFGGQESQNGVIDLPEDDGAVVKLLIQYLYEGEYAPLLPDTKSSANPEPIRPQPNACEHEPYTYEFPHTCADSTSDGACKYYRNCPHHTCNYQEARSGYESDVECCENFVCKKCNEPPPPLPLNGASDQLLLHSKMYQIADKYDVPGLKDLVIEKFRRSCGHFWDDDLFPGAVRHVFSSTPYHDKGLRDLVSATLSDHLDLLYKPEIEILVVQFNDLAYGLLKKKSGAGWRMWV